VPRRSSPILIDNIIYTISDNGVATCRNAQTSEIYWSKRILGDCSASPVYAAGRIYFFGEDGRTSILKPGKQFIALAKNKIEGRIMASIAIAEESIFLRTDTHLYRIQDK